MAKTDFLSFDTSEAGNTDINGIGILGSNAVKNFDNAFRTLMAILRRDLDNGVVYAAKSGNYTAVANDNNAWHRYTATATVSLTAAATLGADWHYYVQADGATVTIDPNASETINGAATLVLQSGQTAAIICNGADFVAVIGGTSISGPAQQGYIYGLNLSNNVADATNDIDIAVGAAAADTSPYYLMQLTGTLTKRLDAAWAVGSGNGGLDTGSIANTTYHVWLIQRSDTGVVDALFSTSATSPTMPTNYDRKRRIGSIIRQSAAILAFRQFGNRFLLSTVQAIRSSTSGATDILVTCISPLGVRTRPILNSQLTMNAASSGNNIIGDGDSASATFQYQLVSIGAADTTVIDQAYTNTSSQVRFTTAATAGTYASNVLNSVGWWDDRGVAG